MNVVIPITVRAAQLTSSSIPYPDTGEAAYNAGTAYALGDTVAYTIDGLIHKFKSKQESNTGHTPEAYPNENSWWLDLGAANRFNMFQLERNTQSEGASPLVVQITPGQRFGAIGLGNIEADSVRLQVYNGASLIYDQTRDLIDRTVLSWYDYFYQPFRQIKNTLFTDLPILTTAKAKLTFTRSSGNVKVGFVVMGVPFNLGKTENKVKAEALNFSEIERDEFAEAKLTPRRDIPKTTQTVLIEREKLNQVRGTLSELNAKVALWHALSDPLLSYFDATFIIGVYKRRDIDISPKSHAYLNLELEQI
ncbi:hypothetical protein [Nitrosomonas sp. Nm34]|uniref:hypothetical protein n=1 Tax=Nitrosomonas sp. Nm34 TaxID=1881055 RepID=UPI0008E13E20|nr:hypothetical protein [Nitrosomonas sp. Nm34]SFI31525.1 hypothetical protein SAMN05428978_100577 [Nitrosomonas sp. Nm34]